VRLQAELGDVGLHLRRHLQRGCHHVATALEERRREAPLVHLLEGVGGRIGQHGVQHHGQVLPHLVRIHHVATARRVCCRRVVLRVAVRAKAEGVHEVVRGRIASIDVHLRGIELVQAAADLLAARLHGRRCRRVRRIGCIPLSLGLGILLPSGLGVGLVLGGQLLCRHRGVHRDAAVGLELLGKVREEVARVRHHELEGALGSGALGLLRDAGVDVRLQAELGDVGLHLRRHLQRGCHHVATALEERRREAPLVHLLEGVGGRIGQHGVQHHGQVLPHLVRVHDLSLRQLDVLLVTLFVLLLVLLLFLLLLRLRRRRLEPLLLGEQCREHGGQLARLLRRLDGELLPDGHVVERVLHLDRLSRKGSGGNGRHAPLLVLALLLAATGEHLLVVILLEGLERAVVDLHLLDGAVVLLGQQPGHPRDELRADRLLLLPGVALRLLLLELLLVRVPLRLLERLALVVLLVLLLADDLLVFEVLLPLGVELVLDLADGVAVLVDRPAQLVALLEELGQVGLLRILTAAHLVHDHAHLVLSLLGNGQLRVLRLEAGVERVVVLLDARQAVLRLLEGLDLGLAGRQLLDLLHNSLVLLDSERGRLLLVLQLLDLALDLVDREDLQFCAEARDKVLLLLAQLISRADLVVDVPLLLLEAARLGLGCVELSLGDSKLRVRIRAVVVILVELLLDGGQLLLQLRHLLLLDRDLLLHDVLVRPLRHLDFLSLLVLDRRLGGSSNLGWLLLVLCFGAHLVR